MTGAPLVKHMRRSCPRIPMLIATARTDAIAAEFGAAHNVTMLAKPYDPDDLVTSVCRLLTHPS